MSEDGPRINVTRGKRTRRSGQKTSATADRSRSSGLGLPGPITVVSGMIRGARNAWWAGLGLLSVARDAGTQVFDALVEEGKSWEQARRERTERTAQQVQELVGESDAIEAVENRVRDEVNAALRRAGVPRRDEVDALRTQIDALGERIEHLQEAVSEEETGASK